MVMWVEYHIYRLFHKMKTELSSELCYFGIEINSFIYIKHEEDYLHYNTFKHI